LDAKLSAQTTYLMDIEVDQSACFAHAKVSQQDDVPEVR
jgi:hypothetical protein